MRMSMLTAYYYVCADILKEYLPYMPELKITNTKRYYGQTELKDNKFLIRLSKWNLDCGPISWWNEEDFDELIDTICHEFAHLFYWDHGKDHTEMTNAMKDMVKAKLEIKDCERKLEKMNIA